MRLSNLTLEEMTEAMNRGWAQKDSRIVLMLQQERAGVKVAVDRGALRRSLEADPTTATEPKVG
jgi:3-hydroxyisobutyrate dehydrogenase